MRQGALVLAFAGVFAACRQDMHDQPRLKSLAATTFFADGRAARPQVPGTVAHGDERTMVLARATGTKASDNHYLAEDDHRYRGKVGGQFADTFPFEIAKADLVRGRERFAISCAPCHGLLGDGNGMAVARGMRRPPSFHIDRLQKAGPGYVFNVITNGFGQMIGQDDRIKVEDRWRITAYVRALQLSQNAAAGELSQADLEQLAKVK